jgi:flagellar hook assembly protein FlgD
VAETLYVYNFPNPFNTKETEYTTIKLWLPKDAEEVVIKLLDTATCSIREWRLGPLSSGTHIIEWYGRNDAGQDVGSGVYILVLEAHYVDGGLQRAFNKILLLRK